MIDLLVKFILMTQLKITFGTVFLSVFLLVQIMGIKKIFNEDDRIMESIISDIEEYLNKNLKNAGSRFSATKKQISISLKPIPDNKTLKIQIKERLKNALIRYFKITDIRKGFIWYYNFIIKIRFNPKQRNEEIETIFLLDEPGSYLHETAQKDLCKK